MAEQIVPIWIPVGIPLGYWYHPEIDLNDSEAPMMAQKVGAKYLSMPISTYIVWDSAFERHDREGIIDLAKARKVSDPGRRYDELVEDGEIVNLNGDLEYVTGLMSYYRVIPAAVGLGNDRGNMLEFRLGLPHHPRVELDHTSFSVWAASNAHRTLLDACKQVADEGGDTLEDVVTVVAHTLPAMLTGRVAFLDTAV
jgi:hypothetical protein